MTHVHRWKIDDNGDAECSGCGDQKRFDIRPPKGGDLVRIRVGGGSQLTYGTRTVRSGGERIGGPPRGVLDAECSNRICRHTRAAHPSAGRCIASDCRCREFKP